MGTTSIMSIHLSLDAIYSYFDTPNLADYLHRRTYNVNVVAWNRLMYDTPNLAFPDSITEKQKQYEEANLKMYTLSWELHFMWSSFVAKKKPIESKLAKARNRKRVELLYRKLANKDGDGRIRVRVLDILGDDRFTE